MPVLELNNTTGTIKGIVNLPGSKSESNRALIIQSLCHTSFHIHNLSTADDTRTLENILLNPTPVIDAGPAGTVLRFLTARLATARGEHLLTGSPRMLERPVGILVDALRELGADITYTGKEGYPPLKIRGKRLKGGILKMDGSVSSQFITAIALIAPTLDTGIEIHFTTELISRPYLEMTLQMMAHFGVKTDLTEHKLAIPPAQYKAADITVEPDWSAASYWYEIASFSDTAHIFFPGLREQSLQGDSAVNKLFYQLGVITQFKNGGALIKKNKKPLLPSNIEMNCESFPDLAQTLAVTFAGLGIEARLSGLKSLRIKETDRISALIAELGKFGINAVEEEEFTLFIPPGKLKYSQNKVNTHDDHRMAMAFAPLVLKTGRVLVENPSVVKKSYPGFWDDMLSLKAASLLKRQ